MACDLIAGLKVIEVCLCIVCLLYKLWTVWETLRVFYELEKQSREWPLSRRIAVDRTGSIFSDIVLGSYVIITLGLLFGHLKGELTKARTTEGFFLVLGTILFLIVGGISITSVDDVPHKLVDNGIILGILTILTAIVFLLDVSLAKKQVGLPSETKPKKPIPQKLQKEPQKKIEIKPQVEKINEDDKDKKKKSMFQELKSSLKRRSMDGEANQNHRNTNDRNVEFQERELHDSERQKRAVESTPPQVGRRQMENRGFSRSPSQEEELLSRHMDPEEFERSFSKVHKAPNGYLKNENRQSAFTMRDDERSYSRNDEPYNRYEERVNPFTRLEEYHSNNSRQPNGHIKRQDSEFGSEVHRPNGYIRQNDKDGRQYTNPETSREVHHPNGYIRREDEFHHKQQRRHSIDYVEKDDRIPGLRSDDQLRRSKDYDRGRSLREDEIPRGYRSDEEYLKSKEKFEFDLRKPQYIEDKVSYKGYADTVRYLERTSSEKNSRIEDVDSAMPPKHVIEVEMDDHFYRPGEPQSRRSDRRLENRDTLQVAKVTSSQKQEHTGSSDESELVPQIPSVSFLLSEKGRKIMPSLSTSPVERVSSSTPKYYFSDPSSPGFVKQTASNWPTSSPGSATPSDSKHRGSP